MQKDSREADMYQQRLELLWSLVQPRAGKSAPLPERLPASSRCSCCSQEHLHGILKLLVMKLQVRAKRLCISAMSANGPHDVCMQAGRQEYKACLLSIQQAQTLLRDVWARLLVSCCIDHAEHKPACPQHCSG